MLNTIIEADDAEAVDYDGILVVECLLAVLIGKPRSVGCLECLMIHRQTTNHRWNKALSVARVHPLKSRAPHRSNC